MKQLIENIEGRFQALRESLTKGLITREQFDANVADIRTEVENLNAPELTALDMAFERCELAKLAANEARKELVALLPFASPHHVEVIVKCISDGQALPVGYRPNVDVQLTDTAKQAVEKARKARQEFLTKWWKNDEAAVVSELREAGDLTSYTVKVGDKSTTTALKFTKSHGKKPLTSKRASAVILTNFASIASRSE